jgi:hypothetical protein
MANAFLKRVLEIREREWAENLERRLRIVRCPAPAQCRCGAQLEKRQGVGRKKSYCSEDCARDGRNERRREMRAAKVITA